MLSLLVLLLVASFNIGCAPRNDLLIYGDTLVYAGEHDHDGTFSDGFSTSIRYVPRWEWIRPLCEQNAPFFENLRAEHGDDTPALQQAVANAIRNGIYPPAPCPGSVGFPEWTVGVPRLLDAGWDDFEWSPMPLTCGEQQPTLVAHHTLSTIGNRRCVDVLRDTYNYHTWAAGRAYGDGGYHFLACEDDGGLYLFELRWCGPDCESRPMANTNTVGGHTRGLNSCSIGGALIADLSGRNTTEGELSTLASGFCLAIAYRDLSRAEELAMVDALIGHRDAPNNRTACPGQLDIEALRENIRTCLEERP